MSPWLSGIELTVLPDAGFPSRCVKLGKGMRHPQIVFESRWNRAPPMVDGGPRRLVKRRAIASDDFVLGPFQADDL